MHVLANRTVLEHLLAAGILKGDINEMMEVCNLFLKNKFQSDILISAIS